MIDRKNLVLKVAALVGYELNGDVILQIEQHIPMAIQRVSKHLVDSKDPARDLLITTRQMTVEANPRYGYEFVILRDEYIRLPNNTLFEVSVTDNASEVHIVRPVNSLSALSLASTHAVSYYMVDGKNMFFNLDPAITGWEPTGVTIYHYEYMSLDADVSRTFPDELESYLVAELAGMVKNEQEKMVMDKLQP
jgi:hypothetical protein